jgi:hypothetical protein
MAESFSDFYWDRGKAVVQKTEGCIVDSKMFASLPAEVVIVMSAYLRLVDARLPGRVSGLYLVGSLALDDYRSGQSDIDFVTVIDPGFTPSELTQLKQIHNELRRARKSPTLDGVYVTWSELRAEPKELAAPYCLNGRFFPSGGFAANPVTWSTIFRHPVPMRGPANPAIWRDDKALRRWCRENLRSYWADWVYKARNRFAQRLYSYSHQAVIWGVLGVTRLHATIKTGEIISKTAAGAYALEAFPAQWSAIVEDALGGRLGPPAVSRYGVFARRRDALAFMEYVISDVA